MSTNIGLLPQLAGALPSIVTNGDWRFSAPFVVTADPSTPVDITGISFEMQVRSNSPSPIKVLDISTAAGTLINGGTNGILTWAVPNDDVCDIAPGSYVADLIATADGMKINLFGAAPAAVSVIQGVTR